MTARLTPGMVLNGGQRHPGRFAFFLAWTVRKPRRAAIWQTTALFGGVGCSLLHVTTVGQAVAVYLASWMLAPLPLFPWFLAEYRISGGWRR
jgi:hypothetical protein